MIKIGLVGEDPHDTSSIKHLLLKEHKEGVNFFSLIRNKKGDQLNNSRAKAALRIECEDKKPHIVIFIKDADAIVTETKKIEEKRKWYQSLSKDIHHSILLLNIYELEALIFADINTFNKEYNTEIKNNRDITYIKEPKEELKRKTNKNQKEYHESHCPDIFKLLDIEIIKRNCPYFRSFITELSAKLQEIQKP